MDGGVEKGMSWNILPEYLACVVLVLVALFSHERYYTRLPQTRLYRFCLGFALGSTALDIGTVALMSVPGLLPMWGSYLLNLLYFTGVAVMEATLTYYLVFIIHGKGACLRRARWVLGACMAAVLAVVCTNPATGLLFRLEAGGAYVRGPLNRINYLLLVICCLLLVMCYAKGFRAARREVHRMMLTLPPVAVILGTIQYLRPQLMMTGFIQACVLLVLYFNFQSQRISTDYLTGLSSRSAFFRAAGLCRRRGEPFYCAMVCLRSFGEVNGEFGHEAGDQFLRQVAAFLEGLDRRAVVCRFSGVEFALLFPGMAEGGHREVQAAIAARFARPWEADGRGCRLNGGSAWLACPRFGGTEREIVERLEYAVRVFKRAPECSVLEFDALLCGRVDRRRALREVIARALNGGGGTWVVYQPVYDCAEGRPCAAEALLRVSDGAGETLSTAEVIDVAEESGAVVELDWMVLEMVCDFLSRGGAGPVSVNFSARQFLEPDAAQRVLRTLERFGVAPGQLKLEITERVFVRSQEAVRAVMDRLSGAGVGFYLDDFGTGYSNLGMVAGLPFEFVKIDRSLLESAEREQKGGLLLGSLINTFHAMGCRVVVEGVETPEQLALVRGMGADRIQGYYYARPLAEADYRALAAGAPAG